MASHVTYEKKLKQPSGNRLLFTNQNSDIVSEYISLKYRIKLLDVAPKPMEKIVLTIEMLNPAIYEIEGFGDKMEIEFNDRSNDFTTDTLSFRVKIIDPDASLDKLVNFEVTVMDVEEGISFPTDNKRFYSFTPTTSLVSANQSPRTFF